MTPKQAGNQAGDQAGKPPGRRSDRRRILLSGGALGLLLAVGGTAARAQLGGILTTAGAGAAPVSRDAPVTFQADRVEYDHDGALVTASGHVEAWQNDRTLYADTVTFDRQTNVAAATGHVVIIEPDGQVLFSDYAELTQGMRDGVLRDMRARLAENGKLAANGARRLEAQTNELSRVIYSTCNVCAQHPERSGIWDIRAGSAVQDLVKKRIEYTNAVVDIYGFPVAYFPYLTQPDPSQKRASGFLVPSVGESTHLGVFAEIPYYLVIDDKSDATITPVIASSAGPALDAQYRLRLNEGTILANGSIARDQKALQGHIFTSGRFDWDETWRYGFDVNRASSAQYLRDFKVSGSADVLTSQAYLEGFGQGSYARLDARAYQGLTTSIVTAKLPFALPRYEYSFIGEPDALGGRTSVDLGAFNVLRSIGTSTQRANLSANWERPATGALGDLYSLVLHLDSAAYNAHGFQLYPNYGRSSVVQSEQAMPTVALNYRWPFMRGGGDSSHQTVEPIVQLVAAPNGSSYAIGRTRIPNEDSFDVDFTDANLFSLNRFSGVDRLEGGMRANVALHGSWTFPDGSTVDAQVGQAYRLRKENGFPAGSGLENTASDIVSHLSYQPNRYVDLTSRQRFDHRTLDVTFADAVASAGTDLLRVSAGYLYSNTTPYYWYDNAASATLHTIPGPPRNEISFNATTKFGVWRANGFVRRDLQTRKMVAVGLGGAYEDECFIFDVRYSRRYTSIAYDHGDTTVLFTVTLKTVGQFGFHAS